jgi:hypothetical protein
MPKESPRLESRTASLLKTRVQEQGAHSASPKKRPLRNMSNSTVSSPSKTAVQRLRCTKTRDDSPLLTRLTRSTTTFDLKTKPQRVSSETGIPKPVAKRISSEKHDIARPTRSSQLKKDASMMNLKVSTPPRLSMPATTKSRVDEKLSLPKTRKMTKSFSVNVSLKDLTNSSIPQRKTRKPSEPNHLVPIRKVSTPRGSVERCQSAEQLQALLKTYHRTANFIAQWGKDPLVENSPSLKPSEVIDSMPLNMFERAEIIKQDKIYYLGNVGTRRISSNFSQNFGFDDHDQNLMIEKNDHIGYRYQVLSRLGTGAFGNVYRCFDHKLKTTVSLKIMRNDPTWSLQSMYEIKILKKLQGKSDHLLQYCEYLNFRSHICVTAELLSVNLIEALGATKYQGFGIDVIKLWSKQLLSGLEFLHGLDIVHADLKPENLMLQSPCSFDLKIIDFGSSTSAGDITYPYIQSRFYRAPEVLLGARYDTKIDIWSFGAVMFEMYIGRALFEAKDESHLYRLFVKLIGLPSARTVLALRDDVFKKGSVNKYNDDKFIDKSTILFSKFDRLGSYRGEPIETPRSTSQFQKRLEIDDLKFADFLKSIFVWNSKERPSASRLLQHGFLQTI